MRNKLCALGALTAGLLVFVPNAGATLQLTLQSGASTFIINDNGAGDANGAVGQITFIGAVGNWILNVTTGTVGTNPIIDLNSVDTVSGNGTGANSLTLKFTSTNLAGPRIGFTSNIGGTVAGGQILTYQGYVDSGNGLYGTATPIGALQSFGSGAFSGTVAGGSIATSLYSATEVVNLSGTGTGTSSFDANIDTAPEPTGVLLLGGVLLLTTGAIRRKLGSKRA